MQACMYAACGCAHVQFTCRCADGKVVRSCCHREERIASNASRPSIPVPWAGAVAPGQGTNMQTCCVDALSIPCFLATGYSSIKPKRFATLKPAVSIVEYPLQHFWASACRKSLQSTCLTWIQHERIWWMGKLSSPSENMSRFLLSSLWPELWNVQ